MKLSAVLLLASSGLSAAQAVTGSIAPSSDIPSGCSTSLSYRFQIAVVVPSNFSAGSNYTKRASSSSTCSNSNQLVLSLHDSVLTDAKNRTGYIASNRQFQFDGPPQSGAIYTAGFSVCANNSLALGGSTVWYQCKSGSFSNLYDQDWAEQCSLIHLNVIPCADNTAQQQNGAQVIPASQTTPLPICQIGDGQIQAHTTSCVDASSSTYGATPTTGASQTGTTLITVPGATTSGADPASTSGSSSSESGSPSESSSTSDGKSSPSPSESAPVTSGADTQRIHMVAGLLGALLGVVVMI